MERAQGALAFQATVAEIPSFHGRRNAVHVSSLLIGLARSYEREVKMTATS